jgi:hypothetical protein
MGNTDISPEFNLPKGKPDRKPQAADGPLLVSDLGWTTEEARETRARLATLEEDWEAPGMDAYEHL